MERLKIRFYRFCRQIPVKIPVNRVFGLFFRSKLKTEPTFREQKLKVRSLDVGSEFDFEQWKGSKVGHVGPRTKNAKIAIAHSKGQRPTRYFLGT